MPYVQMFRRFLKPAKSVLLLGCGGGNLATMLVRDGKQVVVVDCNPSSFDIAREYFSMPQEVTCVTADFREYVASSAGTFDGIGIDVGGPGFCYEEQFDQTTCRAIVDTINPGGRAILNMLVGNDFDAAPDKIGTNLSVGETTGWILDRPGGWNRNLLIAALPKKRGKAIERHMNELRLLNPTWALRRPRHPSAGTTPVSVRIGTSTWP